MDKIATAHDLNAERAQRIAEHKRQRAVWRDWLAVGFAPRRAVDASQRLAPTALVDPWDPVDTQDYLAAVLTTGPPAPSSASGNDTDAAVGLLIAELGATVLAGW